MSRLQRLLTRALLSISAFLVLGGSPCLQLSQGALQPEQNATARPSWPEQYAVRPRTDRYDSANLLSVLAVLISSLRKSCAS